MSHRTALNRRSILIGAVQLIDQTDLKHLTMRRLGASLGVEGMSLYSHVYGREDLLNGIVDLVVDDIYCDVTVDSSVDDWPAYLSRLAYGVRRMALAHPQVFPLVVSRSALSPWVRPPLLSLRWMESFSKTLHHSGFSDQVVVTAYRAFCSFLLGQLLPEVTTTERPTGSMWQEAELDRLPDPDKYPQLHRLHTELCRDHATAEFDASLADLLNRFRVLRDNSARAFTGIADSVAGEVSVPETGDTGVAGCSRG